LLSKKEGFPFRWDIVLQNAKPVQVDMLKGSANGHLSWHGTIDKSIIEGDLAIVRGELLLPKKLPETSVSYPVRYINNEANERKPTEIIAEGGKEIPVELKIEVATNDLSITDEDLKSSWSGKVDVQGTVQKPLLTGEIKLQSGDYILNGQRFVLSQGRVSFNGDFEKRSNLYVSLSREISDYEVEIVLKGLLKDPEILLQSRPALPKAQVLSLILFGQTSADISALQEEQLEQSLSNLTPSSSKKEGTIDKIQKSLGIDHIDFTRSGETASDVRIRLSKYISRGICLSVYRDVSEEVNAVSLEAELLKNIKAQVEAQDNAEGQVSIFWKKNY
jgi:translocation and assembly module TamB